MSSIETEKSKKISRSTADATPGGVGLGRREFLRNAGLGGIWLASFSAYTFARVRRSATAQDASVRSVTTICTKCAVGCSIKVTLQNNIWIEQASGDDSPINIGGYCHRGAGVRQTVLSERRLKYPMRLVSGRWERITWEDAIKSIGDKLQAIRQGHGADAVYWAGSSHFSNEQAYLFRKLAAFWGTNNVDSQSRLCSGPTVAGLANMIGYGSMTNPITDLQNARCIMLIGSNAAETHPIAMRHILEARRRNGASVVVCDPRRTTTATEADVHVQLRPGSDVAFIWGVLRHILDNKKFDRKFVEQRVWGLEYVRKELENWPDARVEQVTGVSPETTKRVAQLLADNRPGTALWGTGAVLHSHGNNVARAIACLQLALGNVGKPGGGLGQLDGHDNSPGVSDMCVLSHSLPGYYGLRIGAWKHWSRVWGVSYQDLVRPFVSEKMMNSKGIQISRLADGVLLPESQMDQKTQIKAVVFWGHSVQSLTGLAKAKKALEQLELIVAVDPFAPFSAVLGDRTDNVILLPASTQMETSGSVTSIGRSTQWREKVIEPLFDSKPDHEIMFLLSKQLGMSRAMFKNIAVHDNEPSIEDTFREARSGMLVNGEVGLSPERIKKQMANQATFDRITMRADSGPCKGEYYGLPWPCWGRPEFGHPGTPILFDVSKSVREGGSGFRARFGVRAPKAWGSRDLLAEGIATPGSAIANGYPEMTMAGFRILGWDKLLTKEEAQKIAEIAGDKTNWKTDLSAGLHRVAVSKGVSPSGNAKARLVVWTFPDPVPVHREPIYTNRRELLPAFASYQDRQMYRLPTYFQERQTTDHSDLYPLILTTGRAGKDMFGAGSHELTPWLAEKTQRPYVEVHPDDARGLGFAQNEKVWVEAPDAGRAMLSLHITPNIAPGTVFIPIEYSGQFQGQDLRQKYPNGTQPHFVGESGNGATSYGYEVVTGSPACKASICRLTRA